MSRSGCSAMAREATIPEGNIADAGPADRQGTAGASRRCGERCGRQPSRADQNQATGIVGYHAYLPAYRLRRGEIAAAIGASARAGSAAWPATTRTARRSRWRRRCRWCRGGSRPPAACGSPPPTRSTPTRPNATAVHAALDLQPGILAADLGATVRSGIVALLAAARDGGLAVLGRPARRPGRRQPTSAREPTRRPPSCSARRDPLARHRGYRLGHGRVHRPVACAPGRRTAETWEERFRRAADTPSSPASCWPGSPTVASSSAGVRRFAVAGMNARAVRQCGRDHPGGNRGEARRGRSGRHGRQRRSRARPAWALADLLDAAGAGENTVADSRSLTVPMRWCCGPPARSSRTVASRCAHRSIAA